MIVPFFALFGLIFFVLPYYAFWLIILAFTKNKEWKKVVWVFLLTPPLFILLLGILDPLMSQKKLDQDDFYGSYVIDRSYFPGKQANWQYNHFRMEIDKANTLKLFETEGAQILNTVEVPIEFVNYNSTRLAIRSDSAIHHILSSHPTIYREVWSFYLVFNSTKFSNMYFKKGKWAPIKD